MSIEPFNRLVKLVARAFYDDITIGDHQPKAARSDNRGIAVVILDALTRRQWVKEGNLAKDLKLHSKHLRKTLRFLFQEKLVARDHRKETSDGAKIHNAAIAATTDGQTNGREGKSKEKLQTDYYCIDYAQIYDVVRYRLHRLEKKLKDAVEDKNTIQEYICPNCSKRYTALDALRLISEVDDNFQCESCNAKLSAVSDKLAPQTSKATLQRMGEQFKPVMDQLAKVKDLPIPEFVTLFAWERLANANVRAYGDSSGTDPSRTSEAFNGTPLPLIGDAKVQVEFSGDNDKEDTKSMNASTPMKVLPPWMLKQGMNLTKEQRGEVKEEIKMEGTSALGELPDDKKSVREKENQKNIQDEYLKAYYAAVLQRQREQEEAAKEQPELPNKAVSNEKVERQVGVKSKRNENEGDEDVEWEDAPPAGNIAGIYKVDLNNVADDASGDDEDNIDWE